MPLTASQLELLEEAATAYEDALDSEAFGYVEGRGIEMETVATFRLGVVADPLPGHEPFRGMLAIPYLGKHGEPLSFKFRCMKDHDHRDYGHGKYMGVSGETARVFNVRAIHEADDTLHVTEGELDAVVLNQIGLPAVGIPGADGFRGHHRRMMAGFSRIYVWGDPDEAGAKLTNTVLKRMKQSKPIQLRDGDVTETYLERGAEYMRSLIEE